MTHLQPSRTEKGKAGLVFSSLKRRKTKKKAPQKIRLIPSLPELAFLQSQVDVKSELFRAEHVIEVIWSDHDRREASPRTPHGLDIIIVKETFCHHWPGSDKSGH